MESDSTVYEEQGWYHPFCGNDKYPSGTTLSGIPKADWLDLKFDSEYGTSIPIAVTVWTKYNIHFNYEYDGADFIISKSCNPPRNQK